MLYGTSFPGIDDDPRVLKSVYLFFNDLSYDLGFGVSDSQVMQGRFRSPFQPRFQRKLCLGHLDKIVH